MSKPETRAVILAAGRGSRMGTLTRDRPKCLLEVGGRRLLDWQLLSLERAGIRSVAVVVGYRREKIRRARLHRFENPGWRRSNSLVSLLAAGPWLEASPCVVAYADIVYHPDVVRELSAHAADLVLPYDVLWRELWAERFAKPETDAESFQVRDGLLREIGARNPSPNEIEGQFMGLIKTTPTGFSQIRRLAETLTPVELRREDVTGTLSRLLACGVPVAALPTRGRWCEIDSPGDLKLCRSKLEAAKGWSHDWRF